MLHNGDMRPWRGAAVLVLLAMASCSAVPAAGKSAAGSTSTVGSSSSTPTTSATPSRCQASDLRATFGSVSQLTPGSSGQRSVPLVFTNVSASTCTLEGYPGLTLVGPLSNGSTSYTPDRQDATAALVTLGPESSAHVTFTYLPGPDVCDSGVAWVPTKVLAIPPGGTTPLHVTWTGGSVDNCQGGATHPGTYVGIVAPGAA